ncbi:MAG: diguanylate cyclase domain-containing protein [Dehalococcoidia bacterium]
MADVWDSLPGIFSWDSFLPFAGLITSQTKRRRGSLSLLLLSLNQSTDLEGSSGLGLEETALRLVAASLVQTIRDGDMVARYGTRAFVILAQDAQQAGAARMGERIRATLPVHLTSQNGPIPLGIGLGIATLPQNGTAVEELIASAQGQMSGSTAEAAVQARLSSAAPAIPRPASTGQVVPAAPAAGPDRDRLIIQRRTALDHLTWAYERGVIKGIGLETQQAACPICLDAARDTYQAGFSPPLPLVGCIGPGGCRCLYTSPALDRSRRIPLVLSQNDMPDIPRKLRDASRFGSDPKRSCKAEELAEYLDGYPLLPFGADLPMQAHEAVYLVRPVRRSWEQVTNESAAIHGPLLPVEQPILPWVNWVQQYDRPPQLAQSSLPGRDEGELYLTNQRLIFRDNRRRTIDNLSLTDIYGLEYLRDAVACIIGDRQDRLVYLVREPLQVGLYFARALRYAVLVA